MPRAAYAMAVNTRVRASDQHAQDGDKHRHCLPEEVVGDNATAHIARSHESPLFAISDPSLLESVHTVPDALSAAVNSGEPNPIQASVRLIPELHLLVSNRRRRVVGVPTDPLIIHQLDYDCRVLVEWENGHLQIGALALECNLCEAL